MKKLIVLLLALFAVLLSLPVSAAEPFSDSIYKEVSQLIDVKQYAADVTDSNIYLVSVMESGYTDKGFANDTALYVYLYNPSQKQISSSELNSIQIATAYDTNGKPTDFKKYRLQLEGDTLGGLFIRAKVMSLAKTLAYVQDGARWYGITEIELHEDGQFNAEAMKVGYVYKFTGYDESLYCSRSSFFTLTLDVHQVSYLTGSSSKPSNDVWSYSNQLNSVYFSIPSSVEVLFGKLYSIQYEYYKVYTNPIIVTDSDYLKNRIVDYVDNNASLSDLYLCAYMDGITDPGLGRTLSMQSSIGTGRDFPYVHDKVNPNLMYYKLYDGSVYSAYYNCPVVTDGFYYEPTVVFGVDEIVAGRAFFDAKDLQNAFIDYTKNNSNSPLFRNKYSKDLICYSNEDLLPSYVIEEKNRDQLFDISDTTSGLPWWKKIFHFLSAGVTATDVSYIEQVSYVDTLKSNFSDTYFVAENEVEDLQNFCKEAALRSENVYLLRYALADNYAYADLYHENCELCEGDSSCNAELYMIQGNAYLDFDIIKLTFGDTIDNLAVFGVVASPTDGFFPGVIFDGKKDPFDWRALLRKVIAVFLVFVLAVALFWCFSLLMQLGQASTSRQLLREYKRKRRYKRK